MTRMEMYKTEKLRLLANQNKQINQLSKESMYHLEELAQILDDYDIVTYGTVENLAKLVQNLYIIYALTNEED